MRIPSKFIRSITRARIMSLMILVALSAVAVWSAKTVTEYYRFKPIREQRLQLADAHKTLLQIEEKTLSKPSPDPWINQWVADMIRHRKDLEQKYRKGAAEPWAELPPDPPEPPTILDRLRPKPEPETKTHIHRLTKDVENILSGNGPIEKTPSENPHPGWTLLKCHRLELKILLGAQRRRA